MSELPPDLPPDFDADGDPQDLLKRMLDDIPFWGVVASVLDEREEYEPASREFNLAQSRRMLARLYGRELEHLEPAADGGECGTAACGRCCFGT